MLTETEKAIRKHRVFRLSQEGLAQSDIANATHLTTSRINQLIKELRKEGKLKKTSFHSINWLKSRGRPICQDSVIRQILQEMVVSKNLTYSVSEVAKMFGKSNRAIQYLCEEGIIPSFYQKTKMMGHYRISENGIEALKQWLGSKTECIVCKNKILAGNEKPGPKKTICDSPDCHAQRLRDLLEKPPDPTSLKLHWHRDLWYELAAHPISKKEDWIGVSEASNISGVKHPLLTYLAKRRVLASRFDKQRTWKGKPIRLFAASQMKIVRRVYQAHH